MRAIQIFLFLTLLSAGFAQANECRSLFGEERVGYFQQQLAESRFNDGRFFHEYERFFSSADFTTFSILAIMKGLPQGSTWVDMGAGNAYAILDGLDLLPKLHGVAISYKRPVAELSPQEKKLNLESRFQYLDGDYVENMAANGRLKPWMGQVALITDVYGPFSYTIDVTQVLQINLNLLAKDGQLFISFINSYTKLFREGSDQVFKITDWLQTIPGLDVKIIRTKTVKNTKTGQDMEEVSLQIIKKSIQVDVSQVLVLKEAQYEAPVIRQYIWK